MNPWDKMKEATGADPSLSFNSVGEGAKQAADTLLSTAGSLVALGLVAFVGKKGFDTMLRRKKK